MKCFNSCDFCTPNNLSLGNVNISWLLHIFESNPLSWDQLDGNKPFCLFRDMDVAKSCHGSCQTCKKCAHVSFQMTLWSSSSKWPVVGKYDQRSLSKDSIVDSWRSKLFFTLMQWQTQPMRAYYAWRKERALYLELHMRLYFYYSKERFYTIYIHAVGHIRSFCK